jgi:hypothetical protein
MFFADGGYAGNELAKERWASTTLPRLALPVDLLALRAGRK